MPGSVGLEVNVILPPKIETFLIHSIVYSARRLVRGTVPLELLTFTPGNFPWRKLN